MRKLKTFLQEVKQLFPKQDPLLFYPRGRVDCTSYLFSLNMLMKLEVGMGLEPTFTEVAIQDIANSVNLP